jgi:hypothetical protein
VLLMVHPSPARILVVIAALMTLGGCGSDRFSTGSVDPGTGTQGGVAPLAAAPSGRVTAAPIGTPGTTGAPPPVAMGGRWVLSASNGVSCRMTFGGGGIEGTIAPEGGCPGNFFTSRKWVFADGALAIRNHNDEGLAQLTLSPAGRFEGRAAGGDSIVLSR